MICKLQKILLLLEWLEMVARVRDLSGKDRGIGGPFEDGSSNYFGPVSGRSNNARSVGVVREAEQGFCWDASGNGTGRRN